MEGISVTVYKGLKAYWKRKGYVKLQCPRRSKVELGSTRRRRRLFWKIRVKPKLRIPSPKKLFVWLRDAYVKMMVGLANSKVVNTSYGGAIGGGGGAFGKRPVNEHEEKVMVEIYKSFVMAQGQLGHRQTGKFSSALNCQR